MFINAPQMIKNLDGTQGTDETRTPLTLGAVICRALMQPDRDANGDDQIKRFKLAVRIHDAKLPVDITVEEGALIKRLVAKLGLPLLTGQIAEAIDNPVVSPSAANGALHASH